MGFESQMINDSEFLLKVETPVREEVSEHQCVCLLIKGPPLDPELYEAAKKAAIAGGVSMDVFEDMVGHIDKCKRMISNPDQPFCDSCEEAEHHLLPHQKGSARNIHKNNKEI